MKHKKILPAFALSMILPATANAQEILRDSMPQFDLLRTEITQTGGMDIDGNPGDLSVTNVETRVILSRPIELLDGLSMIPIFSYEFTQLDFDGAAPFPIHDEDLHSTSLQSIFIKKFGNSPWRGIGWTRAELASDHQGISSEDFTFDIAAGVGYRFNDSFMLGAGFVVINLNGDEQIFPGINFDWTPTDNFRFGLFGPNIRARYTVCDGWFLSLTGTPGGGGWTINDDLDQSRSIDMSSYLVGLNTNHRISGNFWLSAGIGYTFNIEIEIRGNRGGGPSFSREMDGAPYAQIALSLREW